MRNDPLPVLIAEDDPNDVTLLQLALKRAEIHHRIQFVRDGEEVLHYLKGEGEFHDRDKFPFPRFLITDLKMPRRDGFEVLEWLRAHPQCSVIPAVVLSSSNHDSDIRRAYQLGANAYLLKPSSPHQMAEAMRSLFTFWGFCETPRAMDITTGSGSARGAHAV